MPQDLSQCSEPERWVKVSWEDSVQEEFKTVLRLLANDRIQLLADVTSQLAGMHVMIYGMQARGGQNGEGEIVVTIGVNGLPHLQEVITRLKRINGIISVERSGV